ncbi:hypothetical protein A6A04_10510 [Paramagnetospirillum marisnigri]|uniref:Uncharacterized protein n=1 Tax=Paramagnetospirillum marisnigri TaxID=1285242 RepID=A0A178MZJ9_9PROT|nr:hypothetical protein [Paramagnetospirillum marisnigri]OAN55983.1 hypothetical protein A6A04_10510 [Paramagnetospirillum marisnigri]
MIENPTFAVLAASSHLATGLLQVLAPRETRDVRCEAAEKARVAQPICLGDVGWCDHYGHRHGDVDVERL